VTQIAGAVARYSIANLAVTFLASSEASCVTGAVLNVDGGSNA
jgi:NAD(P)-dependent dehydrogenase (short-subunit alcohol dehydrogenase family)